jgi:RimJ/RimL family protein N-acetyltransferase
VSTPKPQVPYSLTDGVVELRRPGLADVPAVTAACQDPEIPRWTNIPSPFHEEHARSWIERQGFEGDDVSFLVLEAGGERLLGAVGLNEIDLGNRVSAVGYWCAADARGRGVIPRAVGLLSTWALGDDGGFRRLEIHVHTDNPASQRVAEKCGYLREGVMRSYREMKGRRVDLVMFSLLTEDLAGSGTRRRGD